jgi:hypothetical protein
MATLKLPRPLLFGGFLMIGLLSGLFVGNLNAAMAAPQSEAKNAQHNTLLVLVDDLGTEQPVLQGIWLAARVEGVAAISWMPIYPQPLTEEASEYAAAHEAIYMVSNSIEDVIFLRPLRAEGAWWDEVFLVDAAALNALQGLAGTVPASRADTWLEPQRALHEQVQSIQTLCAAFPGLGTAATLDNGLALMPGHLQSSLNPFDMITQWDAWAQDSFALTCTHPWAD